MATSIEDCKKYIESVVRQYRITVEPYETVIEDCWRAVWPIIEANSGDINWFAQSDPNFNGIIMNILRDYLEQQEAYDNRDRYAIRKNYPEFIFESYNVDYKADGIHVTYTYKTGEYTFQPTVFINTSDIQGLRPDFINESFLEYLFFNFGIINAINYYKLTFSPKFVIKAGKLLPEQCEFFKKLFYHGLEECMYRNEIRMEYDDFLTIECEPAEGVYHFHIHDQFKGNLIPVGGGKDSVVTLEALRPTRSENLILQYNRDIYPTNIAAINCAKVGGYAMDQIVNFNLTLDPLMLDLNQQGFYNGHIPFSSCLAFASIIMAYLNLKEYVVLSNEASANEGNIVGTTINHQYSKSFEFEQDFDHYVQTYLTDKIHYFSLLRCLNEYGIVQRFIQHPLYLDVFRSCNVGTKENKWCGHCAKCLYVYIMLYPFVSDVKLWQIFGRNMLDDPDLLDIFIGLVRPDATKPFECVGTREEISYSIDKGIALKPEQNPVLYDYYKKNLKVESSGYGVEEYFNPQHNIPEQYLEMLMHPEKFTEQSKSEPAEEKNAWNTTSLIS